MKWIEKGIEFFCIICINMQIKAIFKAISVNYQILILIRPFLNFILEQLTNS